MGIELTRDQKNLIQELKHWYRYRTKPYYSYSGPPGSGKTTIIKILLEELRIKPHEVISAAYVGKAVLLLLRHGLNASTIHSLLYKVVFERVKVDDDDDNQKTKLKMKFALRDELAYNYKLLVIDEASMVDDKLRDDILSFGIPTIFIGDKDQLPPIFGQSSIMDRPDFVLREIMRQALDNPIIYISQCILKGIPLKLGDYGTSKIISRLDVDKRLLTDYDIIICGKNKMRERMNDEIRYNVLGIEKHDPILGDKIINRQNDWNYCVNGIFLTNGTIGYITDIDYSSLHRNYITLNFKPDFMDECFEDLQLDYRYFNTPIQDRSSYGMSKYNKFEFGYCITAHLSQGSEYNRVLFIDQPFHDEEMTRKLQYTAVTRARESVTIIKSFW